MLRYLLDEHLPHLAHPLRQQAPDLIVWRIGDPGAPPRGALDPDLLVWCERHGFVLVTEDASTMTPFLRQHLDRGGHMPGIFVINRSLSHWQAIDVLMLAASLSLPDEHRDQIRYLGSL